MSDTPPFERSAIAVPGLGEVAGLVGPGPSQLLFLHGSADSESCWREVMARLGSGFAPSLVAARSLVGGVTSGDLALDVDRRWLVPLLQHLRPRAIVAHSYGALLALRTALADPAGAPRLALVEPIAFGLLDEEADGRSQVDELNARFFGTLEQGNPGPGVRGLVDYWNGEGAWDHLPQRARDRLLAGVVHTEAEVRSGREDRTTSAELARLVGSGAAVFAGEHTTRESHRVCARFAAALGVSAQVIPGAGHQGPRTHGPELARRLRAWLDAS